MKKNINFLADKQFSSELSCMESSSVISNGANDHRKLNFSNFLSLQGHDLINVPFNNICYNTNVVVLCINETQNLRLTGVNSLIGVNSLALCW